MKSKIAGVLLMVLGGAILVWMGLVNYSEAPQWQRAMIDIGMGGIDLITLIGASLSGLGIWLMIRKPGGPA